MNKKLDLLDPKYLRCSTREMIKERDTRSITILPLFKISEELQKEYEKLLNITINQEELNFFAVWQGWGTHSYHIIPVKVGDNINSSIDNTMESVLKLESLLKKYNKYQNIWTEFVSKETIQDEDKDTAVEYNNPYYVMIKQNYIKMFTLCALNTIYNTGDDMILGSILNDLIELCEKYNKIEEDIKNNYRKSRRIKDNNKKAVLISGFPGIGKTQFMKDNTDLIVLDSDSSNFSWIKDEDGNNTKERNPEFPQCYINHIKENIDKADVILISSHEIVRQALKDNDLGYMLAYPAIELKEEYMNRYIQRGSDYNFIKVVESNWDKWISDIEKEEFPLKVELRKNEYLNKLFEGNTISKTKTITIIRDHIKISCYKSKAKL